MNICSDVLMSVVDFLPFQKLKSLIGTSNYEKIKNNDKYWNLRLAQDFSKKCKPNENLKNVKPNENLKNVKPNENLKPPRMYPLHPKKYKTSYNHYKHLYLIRKQDLEYPITKMVIELWLKDTVEVLCLGLGKKLKVWPERLKFKANRIILLDCSNNKIKKIPTLPNCRYLNCSYNKLTAVPVLPECRTLKCSTNKITKLGSLPKCKIINCSWNHIENFPTLKSCVYLCCRRNLIAKSFFINTGAVVDCSHQND